MHWTRIVLFLPEHTPTILQAGDHLVFPAKGPGTWMSVRRDTVVLLQRCEDTLQDSCQVSSEVLEDHVLRSLAKVIAHFANLTAGENEESANETIIRLS
jgi:hypothetical protein